MNLIEGPLLKHIHFDAIKKALLLPVSGLSFDFYYYYFVFRSIIVAVFNSYRLQVYI